MINRHYETPVVHELPVDRERLGHDPFNDTDSPEGPPEIPPLGLVLPFARKAVAEVTDLTEYRNGKI